jgi:colicin import membrane protein
MPTSKEDYWNTGLWLSLVGHVVVLVIVIVRVFPNFGNVPPPVVYSISLESGKVLGGKGQVPKESKKSKLAPIKKASAEKPPEKNKKKASTSKKTSTTKTVSLAKKSTKNTKTAKVKKKSSTPKSTKKKVVSKKKTSKAVEEDVDKRLQAALQRYLGESSQGGGKGFGAAKVGGKGMGGGVVRPPEFFAYEKIVRTRIKDAWRWYKGNSTLITVIAFRIEPDGTIKNVRLVKSSGDENFDESVTRAAMKASPLPAPPVSVYERYFREVRITFDPRD